MRERCGKHRQKRKMKGKNIPVFWKPQTHTSNDERLHIERKKKKKEENGRKNDIHQPHTIQHTSAPLLETNATTNKLEQERQTNKQAKKKNKNMPHTKARTERKKQKQRKKNIPTTKARTETNKPKELQQRTKKKKKQHKKQKGRKRRRKKSYLPSRHTTHFRTFT